MEETCCFIIIKLIIINTLQITYIFLFIIIYLIVLRQHVSSIFFKLSQQITFYRVEI